MLICLKMLANNPTVDSISESVKQDNKNSVQQVFEIFNNRYSDEKVQAMSKQEAEAVYMEEELNLFSKDLFKSIMTSIKNNINLITKHENILMPNGEPNVESIEAQYNNLSNENKATLITCLSNIRTLLSTWHALSYMLFNQIKYDIDTEFFYVQDTMLHILNPDATIENLKSDKITTMAALNQYRAQSEANKNNGLICISDKVLALLKVHADKIDEFEEKEFENIESANTKSTDSSK